MSDLHTAQGWLAEAERIAVLTGAGVSQESGIPVFRGAGGLWRRYRAEQLATPEAFARDPKLVWEWYDWRRSVVADTRPNPGHFALAELERRTADFTLVTQNVDGLHDRAGSKHILKLHGDLWTVRCLSCGVDKMDHRVPLPDLPPQCECGGLLRPGVVWFGEALPGEILQAAIAAARASQVFLVVGTSAVVQPAASLPLLARESGARVIEVNAEETPLTPMVDVSLRGSAGELLPPLVEVAVRP
jgi:NAD-dependent deacetylase